MASERSGSKAFLFLFILAVLIALSIPLVSKAFVTVETAGISESHAEEKHGTALALQVRKCLNDKGAVEIWVSDERNTFAECVELDRCDWCDQTKQWGIKITDKTTGQEKTIFLHEGDYMSLDQYLIRQLYVIIFHGK